MIRVAGCCMAVALAVAGAPPAEARTTHHKAPLTGAASALKAPSHHRSGARGQSSYGGNIWAGSSYKAPKRHTHHTAGGL